MADLNYYGREIIPPEYFDGAHFAAFVPTAAGLPPACSCGWTRHEVDGRWYELADHLADMNEGRRENRRDVTDGELRRRQAPLDVLREETRAMREAYELSDQKHPDHHETFADVSDAREV